MKIRYLLDGISKLSEDTHVVAQGQHYYFIVPSKGRLLGINKKFVPVAIHADSEDDPMDIAEYIEDQIRDTCELDLVFHLPSKDQTN